MGDMINIGAEPPGVPLWVNPAKLVDTRALVCANSGGGKSYVIRNIIEKVLNTIPTLVLDREGEFSTLRQKGDLVLVGSEGEIPTSVATAAKLARKLMEQRVSAVIDLSDLQKPEKRRFVRLFLESLLSLPRSLWTPTLVVIDEAHTFAPESGVEAESCEAVVGLMDQGRKRGLGGILATQRLSKLTKDATGEANNLLIGRFAQDVDLARSSSLLGFSGKSEWSTMRSMLPGEFYAVGPAFGHAGVVKFRSGPVQTTHPTSGDRASIKPPAPSKRILGMVGEFAELQRQVESETSELEQLRDEVRRLRKGAPPPSIDPQAIEQARQEGVAEGMAQAKAEFAEPIQQLLTQTERIQHLLTEIAPPKTTRVRAPAKTSPLPPAPRGGRAANAAAPRRGALANVQIGDGSVGHGAKRAILNALVQHGPRNRRDIGLLTCLVSTAGSFGNVLSELRQQGWMRDLSDGRFEATVEGRRALGEVHRMPAPGRELAMAWAMKFTGGTRLQYEAILRAGARGITRAELGAAIGREASAGSFGNNLSAMRKQGVMVEIGKGPERRFMIDPVVTGLRGAGRSR